ncbi:MAG: tetratricopeptide repeat protein [Leptospirales bacterium]
MIFRVFPLLLQCVVACALILFQGPLYRNIPVWADPLVNPGDPPKLVKGMRRSARLILEGHPRQAIPGLLKLERSYPDYAMVHFLLGLAYGKLDQNGKAVLEEKKAIVLNPKNEAARVSYGIALGNTGHFRQEIRAEREALALNPKNEMAWESIGWAYASLAKWPLARAAEEKALRLRKDDPAAHMILGVSLAHLGFPEEGMSQEKKAANLDPEDKGVKRAISWISGILHPVHSPSDKTGQFNPLLSPENGAAPPGAPNPFSSPSQNSSQGQGQLRAPAVAH